MFEAVNNFSDDLLREELKDMNPEQLQEMLEICIAEEDFEKARVIKLEIESRTI